MLNKTRRQILKTGAIGAVAGTALVSGLNLQRVEEAKASSATHPYGYPANTLDAAETRQLAYDGYHGIILADGVKHAHCSFATFHALISQLAAKIGAPYDGIPTQMMEWGSGGVAGYASLCGAINGTCAALGIINDSTTAKEMISDLLNWVYETSLPSTLEESGLIPEEITQELPRSVAGSNLCHVSVTKWCLASGFASGSPERSERCARLCGDIAAKAVEMLNGAALSGIVPRDNTVCGSCHKKGTDYELGQFTRGKMDCTSCHVDLEKVNEDGHYMYLLKSKK